MRRIVYRGLLGLPGKVLSVGSGLLGAVGTVAPEFVQQQTKLAMTPENIRLIGVALLALAFIYLLLLWLLKPGERNEDGGGTQATQGPNSPILSGTFQGPITQYFQPVPSLAATQERKSPHGSARSPWDDPKFRLSDSSTWHTAPKPDMELQEVCDRLYDSLGGPPQLISDFEKRVDRKIRDGVTHWKLHTWGRKNDPNAGLDDVWKDAWVRGQFSHNKGWLRFKHPDNPRYVHQWTDLHFNREEVDEWLPPQSGRSPVTGY